METIKINTDKTQLDLDFIHHFISTSYWAKGRTKAEVQTCIDHSLNFGVYLNGKQIGYARIVTDYVAFGYLMDVFIDESYRGSGYSKKLMEYILACDQVKQLNVLRLATADAHLLYRQFGFMPLAAPEKMMERPKSA